MPGNSDLKLKFGRVGADLAVDEGDLETVSDSKNLAQAIILRLTTEEGELDDIGHADYGSRLYRLVGLPNNQETKNRIRNTVRYALAQEDRIKEIAQIRVETDVQDPSVVNLEISVVPTWGGGSINISYPFSLEGE